MKAVNLMPSGSGRDGRGASLATHAPTYIVFAVLAVAVAFVTVYVLTSNAISKQKAKLASLQEEVAQVQAQTAALSNYTQFASLVQQRIATVRMIAEARFDWHATFTDLSKVVPANTSLQTLNASVSPGVNTGAGTGGSSVLRSAIQGPAFDLTGCTRTQDDVARLMSRLRLIDGVTRVTLGQSQKSDSSSGGGAIGGSGGASGSGEGCPANMPTFDIVVFLTPVPGSAALGVTAGSTPATTTTTTTTSSSTTSSSTTAAPGSTSTPSTATTTPATTTTPTATK